MATEAFVIDLCCRVDAVLGDAPQHLQATLYTSETVTLAFLDALKGTGGRAFYRWLARDNQPLCPALPERMRPFRRPHRRAGRWQLPPRGRRSGQPHALRAGRLQMHLAFAVAVFNLAVAWDGLRADAQGGTHLALVRFSL